MCVLQWFTNLDFPWQIHGILENSSVQEILYIEITNIIIFGLIFVPSTVFLWICHFHTVRKIYEHWWIFVYICEYLWILMNICEYLWIFVNICEYLWIFVNICEYLWIFVNIYGSWWIFVNSCEYLNRSLSYIIKNI